MSFCGCGLTMAGVSGAFPKPSSLLECSLFLLLHTWYYNRDVPSGGKCSGVLFVLPPLSQRVPGLGWKLVSTHGGRGGDQGLACHL